jgi:hypothetical protein
LHNYQKDDKIPDRNHLIRKMSTNLHQEEFLSKSSSKKKPKIQSQFKRKISVKRINPQNLNPRLQSIQRSHQTYRSVSMLIDQAQQMTIPLPKRIQAILIRQM